MGLAFLSLAVPPASQGEAVEDIRTPAENHRLDVELKALRPPVRQPLADPFTVIRGAPAWPLYKEQPPLAQQDLRTPPPVPPNAVVKKPQQPGPNPPPPPPPQQPQQPQPPQQPQQPQP